MRPMWVDGKRINHPFFGVIELRIKSMSMREGKQKQQEDVVANSDGKADLEKWVEWFRKTLQEALETGDDVEILIGRKPTRIDYVA